MKNKFGLALTMSLLFGSLFIASSVFAQSPHTAAANQGWAGHAGMKPGVFGSVTAVIGSTLTVESRGFGNMATTTYSVDAASATVIKGGTTSTLGSVAVGDMVMVEGTLSGTSVVATAIRDLPAGQAGMMPGMGMRGRGHASSTLSSLPPGNGQPVVGGSVTSINGNSLTITNKSSVTYTIDGTSATVTKGGASASLSSVVVGDNLVVQGTVNGNAVVASSILDQGNPSSASSTSHARGGGFLGTLGGFFQHIFGFF